MFRNGAPLGLAPIRKPCPCSLALHPTCSSLLNPGCLAHHMVVWNTPDRATLRQVPSIAAFELYIKSPWAPSPPVHLASLLLFLYQPTHCFLLYEYTFIPHLVLGVVDSLFNISSPHGIQPQHGFPTVLVEYDQHQRSSQFRQPGISDHESRLHILSPTHLPDPNLDTDTQNDDDRRDLLPPPAHHVGR